MTPPLPDRIAAALSKLKGWAMWPDGYPHHRSAELDAAIAEVVAERDDAQAKLAKLLKAAKNVSDNVESDDVWDMCEESSRALVADLRDAIAAAEQGGS